MSERNRKPPPLEQSIRRVAHKYLYESDRELRILIGEILEGKVKMPYARTIRTEKGDK
jgi:hypothetical protein